MSKNTKRLADDARCLADSYALASARTTTAKRALDDAIRDEKAAGERVYEAIRLLAAATSSDDTGEQSTHQQRDGK